MKKKNTNALVNNEYLINTGQARRYNIYRLEIPVDEDDFIDEENNDYFDLSNERGLANNFEKSLKTEEFEKKKKENK